MTDEVRQEGFAPCPTCRQYSHSIGDDALAKAFMHFETMYADPVRGHAMGQVFDDQTRDAAQVLTAEARHASPLRDRIAVLEGALVAEREDNLWNAYHHGHVRDGQWDHQCMSEGEWLARECGFNVSDCRFNDGAVRASIPKAARNVLATLNGEKKDG